MTSNNIPKVHRIACRLSGTRNASKSSGKWVNTQRALFEIVILIVDFFMKICGFDRAVGD
jgi:hypothetical protein